MTVTTDPLAYYAAQGCALFPIKPGSEDSRRRVVLAIARRS
jgi:hypothetical protein